MAIDPDFLLGLKLPELRVKLRAREVSLYALGVGMASDPLDAHQLSFVYERSENFQVMPSLVTVYPAMMSLRRAGNTGIDFGKLVHGTQGFRIHRPFEPDAELVGRAVVTDVVDKGEGKGALVYIEGEVIDARFDERVATVTSMYFCRGDGGFGGKRESRPVEAMPQRAPDHCFEQDTALNLALIYRLSGDYNPLHVDPVVASRVGFTRPILHGRATFGIACHALLRLACDYKAERLCAMDARFTSPVYPGDRLHTEIWRDGARLRYRVSVPTRGVVALDNGMAEVLA